MKPKPLQTKFSGAWRRSVAPLFSRPAGALAAVATVLLVLPASVVAGPEVAAAGGRGAGPVQALAAESDPVHMDSEVSKPLPWPGGVIPYDLSRLSEAQQKKVLEAMKRWEETGAALRFVPHTDEAAFVFFTGRTDRGNNTSQVGYRPGKRVDINITLFWWEGEWMQAHELGHVLGFFHEHQRWDRDRFVTIHYENIKEGRGHDYDWIPRTSWITDATTYDYRSIMHYRVCWAGKCESECEDGRGDSPCSVIDPVGTEYDAVIGQWEDNRISAGDAERVRLVYGVRKP